MARMRYGIAAALAVVVFAGCTEGRACPAVGWINTVQVVIDDDRDAALVCAKGCEGFEATRATRTGWGLTVGMAEPDRLTLVVLDDGGTELHRDEVEVHWMDEDRGPCGGPGQAEPVELVIPAADPDDPREEPGDDMDATVPPVTPVLGAGPDSATAPPVT